MNIGIKVEGDPPLRRMYGLTGVTSQRITVANPEPPPMIDGMKVKRISVAPVKRMAEARGIDNPYALARELEISYPTARKWWNDDQATFDAATLIKMSNYFGCLPGALIEAVYE